MDDVLDHILTSDDPSSGIEEAASDGSIIRKLSPHIYSSLFSSHVENHSRLWYSGVVETALQLLCDEAKLSSSTGGWLLEIAYHGNLALCDSTDFYSNLNRIDDALLSFERRYVNRSSRYVRGLLAYAWEDLEGAERAFTAMSSVDDRPLLSHHAGYAAFRAPTFRSVLTNYDPPLQVNFIQGRNGSDGTSMVLLCAATDVYLAAFGDEFVTQVFNVSSSTHIHFHLINTADPSQLMRSDVLADDRVSISVEQTGETSPGKYSIMARYIILPFIMRLWDKPVLVTDIDMLVRSDPASIDVTDSAIFAFRRQSAGIHVPAATIIGHHNLFMPDNAGLDLATLLSRYLHFMCANRCGLWAADQVALLVLWRMFRDIASIGSFRDCSSYRYGSIRDRPSKKAAAEDRLQSLTAQ